MPSRNTQIGAISVCKPLAIPFLSLHGHRERTPYLSSRADAAPCVPTNTSGRELLFGSALATTESSLGRKDNPAPPMVARLRKESFPFGSSGIFAKRPFRVRRMLARRSSVSSSVQRPCSSSTGDWAARTDGWHSPSWDGHMVRLGARLGVSVAAPDATLSRREMPNVSP